MSQLIAYENIDNSDNKNQNFEESEEDKGFDFTSYEGLKIKNCDILIDSFPIKLEKEEKENLKKTILDFHKEKQINESFTIKKEFSYIRDDKQYICKFLCFIKKIDEETSDIKYGFKEIDISKAGKTEDVSNNEGDENICRKILNSILNFGKKE
jgi:hypothetical protein